MPIPDVKTTKRKSWTPSMYWNLKVAYFNKVLTSQATRASLKSIEKVLIHWNGKNRLKP